MDAKKMESLITEMQEYICDNLCAYPDVVKSQKQLEKICADCKMGDFICSIKNESLKDSKIIRCDQCEYSVKDSDCQGTEFAWCRNDSGIRGNVTSSDGCSRGKRKQGAI